MNFLLIASFPDSVVNFRGALIDEILEKGNKVSVALPNIDKSDLVYKLLEEKKVNVFKIPLKRKSINPFFDLYLLINIFFLIKRIKPDYVLSYTIKPVIFGSIAARLAGIKNIYCLITGLGFFFTDKLNFFNKLVRLILIRLYSLALKFSKNVIFQNPDDQKLFLDLGIISSNSCSSIVNGSGVDILKFTPKDFPVKINFLLISRLLKNKGIREFAKAAREVKKIFPDATFTIGGWFDEGNDNISIAELNSWTDNNVIEYIGQVDDVSSAISKCSIFVLPSYREGTPRTILEAMAMGRPIITSNTAGCKETVKHGENGFLVEVKSTDKLIEAMIYFINNPNSISSMGMRSREIAEKKFDVKKVNKAMLDIMGINKLLLNESNK